jgi:hypothetical protein
VRRLGIYLLHCGRPGMQRLEVTWGVSPISVCINISARLSSAENQCLKKTSKQCVVLRCVRCAEKKGSLDGNDVSGLSLLGSNYIPEGGDEVEFFLGAGLP